MKCVTLRSRGTGRLALEAARAGMNREKAADTVHLSVPMIAWARRIVRLGTPELVAAVENGAVALHTAARVARWSPAAQREFLGLGSPQEGVTLTMKSLAVYAQQQA